MRGVWLGVVVGVWLAACVTGMGVLWVYSNRAGTAGVGPASEPPAAVNLDSEKLTLVVYAHPRCPCTTATVSQIERLLGWSDGGFAVRFVFYEPQGADDDWRLTALRRRAAAVPGAESIADPDGRIAAAAGATTSGTAALYGPDGSVLFFGGLTPSRGHEGESVGLAAVRSILGGPPATAGADAGSADVFGCSIFGSCGVADAGGA